MEDHTPERKVFVAKSILKTKDLTFKRILNSNIQSYNSEFLSARNQFQALEQARKQAKNVKWRVTEQLDRHLDIFEKKFLERGGKVLWAEQAEEALNYIIEICRSQNVKKVLTTHSQTLEEINLNEFLRKNKIESVSTDLGDIIQSKTGEHSEHPVFPAISKSKEDVETVLKEDNELPKNLSTDGLISYLCENQRQEFINAQIGITGANFLVAEEGAIAISENEGNIRLATAFVKTHIVIIGIEKMLSSLKDLELFWPMLSTYSTGQKLSSYNNLFFGPRQQGELEGPEDLIVILLDNHRTELLRKEVREALYCIQCGACDNVCPVYKNIGGHTYGTTYKGPIGAVITPHLKDMDSFGHLSFASTICGACSDTCPVHIDIHGMLVKNRSIYVEEGHSQLKERLAWRFYKRGVLHRTLMNSASSNIKNLIFKNIFSRSWGKDRADIQFPTSSFNQLWQQRKRKSKRNRNRN